MHQLFFQNPEFHEGVNLTVRNGDKWLKVNLGDMVEIMESGKDARIALAMIIGKGYMPCRHIPEVILQHEHDPACRTSSGLIEKMKKIYSNFSDDDPVTVILFSIMD